MTYRVVKTLSPEQGFSCAFRQWRATHSHCQLLHGYALGFRFHFQAETLDQRNWVYDFGAMKWVKTFLTENFDHKTVISKDDPYLGEFKRLEALGIISLVTLEGVGCEKFASYVYDYISQNIKLNNFGLRLIQVDCFEHSGNQASFLE